MAVFSGILKFGAVEDIQSEYTNFIIKVGVKVKCCFISRNLTFSYEPDDG